MKPSGVVQRTAAAAHSDSSKQDQPGGSANASAAATAAGGSTNDLEALIQRQEAWKHSWWATLIMAYGSLGVIYGDIGTSPMYALTAVFSPIPDPTEKDVLGGISLIFWAQTLIVLVKYVLIVLHANDHGEGGTFALYTRICRVIGIGTTSSLDKAEHANLLRTAAVAGEIHKATKLARATRTITKLWKLGARMLPGHGHGHGHTRDREKDRDGEGGEGQAIEAAAAAAALANVKVPGASGGAGHRRGLLHMWPLPAASIRAYFQGSAGARAALLVVSVLATAMVVGDGVLTPAISVVSAVNGLSIKTDVSQSDMIGISVAILIGLFMLQSLGTHRVSFLFSPMVALWMVSIMGIGIYNLYLYGTEVFQGLSPHYIVEFFIENKGRAWESLGGVMLTLTGAEALFADLGHFNISSVGVGFSFFVYPCIIIAYLGQGAHVIANPESLDTIFWSTVPDPFFWPMLVIATCTAVVASQALISGSFSVIRQAMTLGVFPPLHVVHTGEHVEGQIYIGTINYGLMLTSIAVVAGFGGSSSKIGNAYGIAVATVMVITTCMVVLVMIVDWEISSLLVVPFAVLYLIIECGFLSSNLTKVPDGGWFAFAVTGAVALVMWVWMSGQEAKREALRQAKSSSSTVLTDVLVPKASMGIATALGLAQGHDAYFGNAHGLEGSLTAGGGGGGGGVMGVGAGSGMMVSSGQLQMHSSGMAGGFGGGGGGGGMVSPAPRLSSSGAAIRGFGSGRTSHQMYSQPNAMYDLQDRPTLRLSMRARRLGADPQPVVLPPVVSPSGAAAAATAVRTLARRESAAGRDNQGWGGRSSASGAGATGMGAVGAGPGAGAGSLLRIGSLQHYSHATAAAATRGGAAVAARRSSADGTVQPGAQELQYAAQNHAQHHAQHHAQQPQHHPLGQLPPLPPGAMHPRTKEDLHKTIGRPLSMVCEEGSSPDARAPNAIGAVAGAAAGGGGGGGGPPLRSSPFAEVVGDMNGPAYASNLVPVAAGAQLERRASAAAVGAVGAGTGGRAVSHELASREQSATNRSSAASTAASVQLVLQAAVGQPPHLATAFASPGAGGYAGVGLDTVGEAVGLAPEEEVGLARLRGIGVYYADSAVGVPPVMWHFLRNVEAVHEVVILLQNQFLPIPYLNALPGVDETQRFGSCSAVEGIPHMYRVVARYGYMDIVDHGPEFIEHMKDYIKDSIKATYLQTRLGTAGAGAGGVGAGGHDSNGVQGAKTLGLVGPGGGGGAGGGGEEGFFGRGMGDGAYGGGGGGGGGGGAGSRSMSRVVSGSLAGEEVFYGGLQDELDLLDTAYDQGVVYYLGRTRIRMKKLNNAVVQVLHDVWYGDMYKWLAINSYDRSESWKVPSNSLVEMAIVLEI